MTDSESSEDLRKLYAEKLALLNELHPSNPVHVRIIQVTMDAPVAQIEQYGNPSGDSRYGSSEQSETGRSSLSMSLGFLKTLTEKKSTRGESFNLTIILYAYAKLQ